MADLPPDTRSRRDSDTVISLSLECIEESPRPSKLKTLPGPPPGPPPPAAALPPLPKGWKQAVTKQGEIYYWNWWSRETTYIRPSPIPVAPPPPGAPPAGPPPEERARQQSGFGLEVAPTRTSSLLRGSMSRRSFPVGGDSSLSGRHRSISGRQPSISGASHHSMSQRRSSQSRQSFSADI